MIRSCWLLLCCRIFLCRHLAADAQSGSGGEGLDESSEEERSRLVMEASGGCGGGEKEEEIIWNLRRRVGGVSKLPDLHAMLVVREDGCWSDRRARSSPLSGSKGSPNLPLPCELLEHPKSHQCQLRDARHPGPSIVGRTSASNVIAEPSNAVGAVESGTDEQVLKTGHRRTQELR